jgi:hypothetical protein
MILIPFDRRIIASCLKTDAIESRLSQAVETSLKWYQHRSEKEFRGHVSENGFRIRRNIRGRNSYLPLIKGKLEPTANGTRVILTFTLHPIVLITLAAFIVWAEILAVSIEKRFNFVLLLLFIGFHCLICIEYLLRRKGGRVL